jgi:hypothetical protein
MMRLFAIFAFLLLFNSCDNPVASEGFSGPYFKIAEFFDKQAHQLNQSGISIEKRIVKDGEAESKFISDTDWKVQFKPFVEADINRPAFVRAYSIDTIANENGNYQVDYKALEPNLVVRKIRLFFSEEDCERVEITTLKDNAIFTSKQMMVFVRNKGHLIKGHMSVSKMINTDYQITVKYHSEN